MGVLGEDRDIWSKSLYEEIMAKVTKFRNEMDIQISKALRITTCVKPKRPTLRHTILKLLKVTEIILKQQQKTKSSRKVIIGFLSINLVGQNGLE